MLNIKRFVCNFFQENCYVVNDNTKQCVVIDCGAYYTEEKAAIIDYIRNNELTPQYLLATHAHIDHCGTTISVIQPCLPNLDSSHRFLPKMKY